MTTDATGAAPMAALVYEAPRVMTSRSLPRPQPGRHDVLLRVAYSGICGSELSGYLGTNSLRQPPLIFGHELSGWIEAVGDDVEDAALAPGVAVAVNPMSTCGRCRFCLAGRQQLCRQRRLLGAGGVPGGNADYVLLPARSALPLPDAGQLRDAAMAEPAACAVRAVALAGELGAGVGPSSSALVVGGGPIGLLILQVLGQWGVRTRFLAELNPVRAELAAQLGAVVVPAGEDVAGWVRERTSAEGVDVAFDAVGAEATRQTCLAGTARGGTVVLVGLHTDATTLPLNTVVRDEIALRGAFSYTEAQFRTGLDWVTSGRLTLSPWARTAPLADGEQWYSRLVEGDPTAKLLLTPPAAGLL